MARAAQRHAGGPAPAARAARHLAARARLRGAATPRGSPSSSSSPPPRRCSAWRRRSSPARPSTPSSTATTQRVVIGLAVLIAVVALADAAVGLLERWTSSQLGENLILDLRRRVFEHVQSMPIAFFTRTHTGALVSRLNNDVIGAQRAFTSALSGVVTNVIVLVLTVGGDGEPVVADHAARRRAAPGLRHPGPPDRRSGRHPRAGGGDAQRRHDHPDDRAVLGPGRHAREALRPPASRRPTSSVGEPPVCATSA